MADKAVSELAQILFPVFDEVLLTQASSTRAASIEELAEAAEQTGASYRLLREPRAALEGSLASTPANGLTVVAGSVALLGEVQSLLAGWE